jgi:hypothetical protein
MRSQREERRKNTVLDWKGHIGKDDQAEGGSLKDEGQRERTRPRTAGRQVSLLPRKSRRNYLVAVVQEFA